MELDIDRVRRLKPTSTIIFMLAVVIMLQLYIVLVNGKHSSNSERLDRVEMLMQYDKFEYGGYGVSKNMVVEDVIALYHDEQWHDMKQTFSLLLIDYVCDGGSEEVVNTLTAYANHGVAED